jgi:hypothetical protein
MSSGSFTFGVVWRANAVRVTVLEGIRRASEGKRSLVAIVIGGWGWLRMRPGRRSGERVIDAKYFVS